MSNFGDMTGIVPQNLFEVVAVQDIGGLEMGVMGNGVPYLTGRGLATLCNIAPSTLIEWANTYAERGDRPRDRKLASLLAAQGYQGDELFVKAKNANGTVISAYPDGVCMAILEYYAFEADKKSPEALTNFRVLARSGLRDYIYRMTGYDPKKQVPDAWGQFHDRMVLNTVPPGYWSIFKETAEIVVAAIRQGLPCDSHTVPDGSVGIHWAAYWKANNLEAQFGSALKHPHVFPDYWPQAVVQPSVNIFPLDSLGIFRQWLQGIYLPEKFPTYLDGKVKKGVLPSSTVEMIIRAVEPMLLEDGEQSLRKKLT